MANAREKCRLLGVPMDHRGVLHFLSDRERGDIGAAAGAPRLLHLPHTLEPVLHDGRDGL